MRYYNNQEQVTLQCDASQSGLGAVLLQQGQPVAYASRALTSAETQYAQIFNSIQFNDGFSEYTVVTKYSKRKEKG